MPQPRIDIRPGTFLMAAVLLLVLPLRWILAWLVAAAVHECAHLLVVRACGGRIRCLEIGPFGARIAIGPMHPGAEALCALAGPLSGLLLLPLMHWLPLVAVFAFLQALFNLLPLYPLDGGRVLRCCLELAVGDARAEKICDLCGKLVFGILFAAGIFACIRWALHPVWLLIPLVLLIKHLPRKIPCKRGPLGLQ